MEDSEDQEVFCDIVSFGNDGEASPMIPEQYGCLNKTSAMTTPIDIMTWKGKDSCGPTPRQRTVENWW